MERLRAGREAPVRLVQHERRLEASGARLPFTAVSRRRIAGRPARVDDAAATPPKPPRGALRHSASAVRAMDQRQTPLRLEQASAGVEPALEPASGDDMRRGAAGIGREPRRPSSRKGGFVATTVGALGPRARAAAARRRLEQVGFDDHAPARPFRARFCRQRAARAGSRSTKTSRRSARSAAIMSPTAPVPAPRSITISPGCGAAAAASRTASVPARWPRGGLEQAHASAEEACPR